ncbi:glycine--tRNA ligase subunit beta [Candidatus Formimonas warabiya]|uniref:Glycine--tRNA ligase beta subunit n=2 Tax=Formimonas warabiya TaxID=1761012 RepID=A0A3G1L232_FORW1|nr:glycine--tRNA ligase subunit beta [Candidatus Formimonas warabiya]
MAKDLLFEIGTEEIPARFMASALKQMKELGESSLKEARLAFSHIHVYGTPRRLALLVEGLAEKQADVQEEVKGPSEKAAFDGEGNPTKAVLGFARGQGVEVKDLAIKETPAGKYVFATKKAAGQGAETVLPGILLNLVHKLYFPKPMRWGDLEMRFARPIRWMVALFGNEVLPVEVEGLKAGRESRSHRFLGQGIVELASPDQYIPKLKENYCIVDQNERKQLIWQQIQETAGKSGGQVLPDDELLEEVTYLLEYPTALCGGFEEKYLALPKEVLITPMREHQRYFPVLKEDGSLLPKFITVRNGLAEHLDIVTAGNEKVLKARLADAEFFYTEDLKKNLADHVPKLESIVFHERLGSLYAKVERVQKLAEYIGQQLGFSPEEIRDTRRAAYLSKADLVTNVVYEFPELQGIMGEYYARHAGENTAVSTAIREHYQPRFAGDMVPQSRVGTAVALADKLDSIVGFFGMNIQPTGSQDPYALRRQALGMVHTILHHNLEISLPYLVRKAYQLLQEQVVFPQDEQKTLSDILAFFKQRMDNVLTEAGIRYDVINAVLAADLDHLSEIRRKAVAISEFRESTEFHQLITGFTRAANLAKNAVKNDVRPDSFTYEEETCLYQEFLKVKEKADAYIGRKDYQKALGAVADLREPIDHFFTAVMVMVDDTDIKENRLALLKQIADYVTGIADLSQLVV